MDKALKKGHICALFTIFVWSTTGISTKVLLGSFTPIEIFFYRIIIAYILMLLIKPSFIKYKSIKEELIFMGAGISGITAFFLFNNFALANTMASNVGVLVSVTPFITAVLSFIFLRDEELQPKFFGGFAISMVGVVLIAYNGSCVLKLNPIGDVLAMFSAISWAVYSVLMKKISTYNYNIILCTRKIFFYGLIFLIPVLIGTNFRFDFKGFAAVINLGNMLYLGIGASAICYMTWNFAVASIGAIKTSIYMYLQPIITIILSAAILSERITFFSVLGLAFILGGIYFSEGNIKFQLGKLAKMQGSSE